MTAGAAQSTTVAAAIGAYRERLFEDSTDLSEALLALAEADAKRVTPFNSPSPQDAVALHVLAHWRRDAQLALKSVKKVDAGAPDKGLAERWLKAMIAALEFQTQGLSLVDPNRAAEAGAAARRQIAKFRRLEEQLDREIA